MSDKLQITDITNMLTIKNGMAEMAKELDIKANEHVKYVVEILVKDYGSIKSDIQTDIIYNQFVKDTLEKTWRGKALHPISHSEILIKNAKWEKWEDVGLHHIAVFFNSLLPCRYCKDAARSPTLDFNVEGKYQTGRIYGLNHYCEPSRKKFAYIETVFYSSKLDILVDNWNCLNQVES